MNRHGAGQATYRGDCTHIVGEIKGPTTYGSYLVAVAADYDHAADRTVVWFAHLGEPDRLNAIRDADGVLRLRTLDEATA